MWQMAANQRFIRDGTQRSAEQRAKNRYQEVRDITCAGEGHFAPACEVSEHFRAEVTRRVQCEAGEGPNGASGPRGIPLPASVRPRIRAIRMAVIMVSTRKACNTLMCGFG